jgi:hypothetical protein
MTNMNTDRNTVMKDIEGIKKLIKDELNNKKDESST